MLLYVSDCCTWLKRVKKDEESILLPSIRSYILILVFYLVRLEHSRNPHGCLTFGFRLCLTLELLLFQKEFSIIPRGELFELDEEVS